MALRTVERVQATLLIALSFVVAIAVLTQVWVAPSRAATSTTTHRPDSTVSGGWTPTPSGAGTNYLRVDEGIPNDNTDYVAGTNAVTDEYGMTNVSSSMQTATSVKLRVYMTRQTAEACLLGLGTPIPAELTMNVRIGGNLQTAHSILPTGSNGTYTWYEHDFNGTWTQAQIDTLQAQVSKNTSNGGCVLGLGNNATFRISTVEAVVTWKSPDFTQNAWRIYQNNDSTTPGSQLAATNTLAEVPNNSAFRLRAGLTVSDYQWNSGTWGAHNNEYKLGYALRTAASCSAQTTGWGVIGVGSGAIRWNDNGSVADNAAIGPYAQDPTTSGSKVHLTYRESTNFTNPANVAVSNTGLWDFSLQVVDATPGERYCLRLYRNTTEPNLINAYTTYPEILVTGDYWVAIVDSNGDEVTSPSVTFPTTSVKTDECATSATTLGTTNQRIRITNDVLTSGWNVTIAPTNDSGALWTGSSLMYYDFNDPNGCSDGGDADSYGGQLSIDPPAGDVTWPTGCDPDGELSWGSNASFSEGTVDSITIGQASPSSKRFCYWDVTNIPMQQQIPVGTQAGAYSIDMTLTMMTGL